MPQFSNLEKWRDGKTTTQELSGEASFDEFLNFNLLPDWFMANLSSYYYYPIIYIY